MSERSRMSGRAEIYPAHGSTTDRTPSAHQEKGLLLVWHYRRTEPHSCWRAKRITKNDLPLKRQPECLSVSKEGNKVIGSRATSSAKGGAELGTGPGDIILAIGDDRTIETSLRCCRPKPTPSQGGLASEQNTFNLG